MKTFSTLWMALPLLAFCAVVGCQKDDEVVADFDVSVSGSSPQALLCLENRSCNALEFEWSFSEGASQRRSGEKNPTDIVIDKKGPLEICLLAKGRKKSARCRKRIFVEGENALLHYPNLHFGYPNNPLGLGCCFSSEEGAIYALDELSIARGQNIDFVFSGERDGQNTFVSPCADDLDIDIPGGRPSEILAYDEPLDLGGVPSFSLLKDAQFLDSLSDTVLMGQSATVLNKLPALLLFCNADGKKGLLWVYQKSAQGFHAEVKMQKY